ncbi:MAG: glycosyltransferase family 2 protein [Candidatus Gottesmanbacteria bacterium]
MKKQKNKPFFSIVIPTYNRAQDLQRALTCIFKQTCKDFTVIVFDNNSSDNTQDIIHSFHDSRLLYRRNKSNIGWVPNMIRAFGQVRGTYVLLHGDDDFILQVDFFSRLKNVLEKKSYGFVRINYLSYSDEQKLIFDFHNQQFCYKELASHSKSEEIVDFIEWVDPFFMTGIVIESKFIKRFPLMRSELAPWFRAMYNAIEKCGAILWSDYEFIASWSKNAAYPRYYLMNGKFRFERYFGEIKKQVSHSFYKSFLDKRVRILISEFPAAKYFTSNANFFRYAMHLLELDPSFRVSFSYWFWVLFSIMTPRTVLNTFRKKMVKNRKDETIPNLKTIYKKVALVYKASKNTIA